MTNKETSFMGGAIVTITVAAIVGSMGYVSVNASRVPEIEAKFESEMKHLNKNIVILTETARETNMQLESYTKHHAKNLALITKSLVTHDTQIEELQKDCQENHDHIEQCKVYHYNRKDK
jgi:uncharacterized protein HemX